MAALSALAGETITDDLTVYDEADFFGDVNIPRGAPTEALNLFFSFDTNEAGVVTDQSGYGNTGTVFGATWTSSDPVNGAYTFDGTNDYIQASDSASLDIRGAFTITVWAKITNPAAVQALVCKHDALNDRAYVLYIESGCVTYQLSSSGSGYPLYQVITSAALSSVLTNWTHIVATWNGTPNAGGAIYINGSNTSLTTTRTTFSGTNIYNSSQPLRVGSLSNGGWFLGGAIGEVRIYDRVLSASERWAVYGCGITNAQFQVSRPTIIKYLVRQGDIEMGTFTNEP